MATQSARARAFIARNFSLRIGHLGEPENAHHIRAGAHSRTRGAAALATARVEIVRPNRARPPVEKHDRSLRLFATPRGPAAHAERIATQHRKPRPEAPQAADSILYISVPAEFLDFAS
jgi:hypothetical protein